MKKNNWNLQIGCRRILLAILLVLTWTSICKAKKKKKWQIQPSLSFYEHYSDNLELSCDSCGDQVSGFKTQFYPKVAFVLPSKRRQIRIDFGMRMDYRTRSDGEDKALYWMDLDCYWGQELSPRTSFEVVAGADQTYTNIGMGTPFVDSFGAQTRATMLEFAPGVRYRLGKKTLTKGALSYLSVDYASEKGIDSQEISVAGYIERKFGTRLNIDIGLIRTMKTFSNDKSSSDTEIPFTVILSLTYFKLRISSSYFIREVDSSSDSGQTEDGGGLGAGSYILWGLGFDLGGKLFKLRKTTFKIDINQDIKDDMYGRAYLTQGVKLKAFHILKKWDIYNEIKYGLNEYIDSNDSTSYYGFAISGKWYISKKKTLEGKMDMTDYTYEGEIPGNYLVTTLEVNYGYQVRDWLHVGAGIGRRQSSSDIDEGNYAENFFGLFAKADW